VFLEKHSQGTLGVKCQKAPKKFPCYKRYQISGKNLDEKTKRQSWIIKIWMKKPILDESNVKVG
jgi:hypothetical protein